MCVRAIIIWKEDFKELLQTKAVLLDYIWSAQVVDVVGYVCPVYCTQRSSPACLLTKIPLHTLVHHSTTSSPGDIGGQKTLKQSKLYKERTFSEYECWLPNSFWTRWACPSCKSLHGILMQTSECRTANDVDHCFQMLFWATWWKSVASFRLSSVWWKPFSHRALLQLETFISR